MSGLYWRCCGLMRRISRVLILLLVALSLMACSSLPAGKTENLCQLFEHKRSWHKAARKASNKWSIPVPTLMAFIHQESRFVAKARPPRRKILWIFPGPRPSSAYGYAQAQDATWREYQQQRGGRFAQRDNFSDAVDFVGWYNHLSHRRNGIAKTNTYSLYLAYHEGRGGYSRKTYADKPWLLAVARKVDTRARQYNADLARCRRR